MNLRVHRCWSRDQWLIRFATSLLNSIGELDNFRHSPPHSLLISAAQEYLVSNTIDFKVVFGQTFQAYRPMLTSTASMLKVNKGRAYVVEV